MTAVFLFAGCTILTISFLILTAFEKRRDSRVLGKYRSRLDRVVGRAVQYVKQLEVSEMIEESAKYLAYVISHTAVSLLHLSARYIERMLRRLRLRLQHSRRHQERSPRRAQGDGHTQSDSIESSRATKHE